MAGLILPGAEPAAGHRSLLSSMTGAAVKAELGRFQASTIELYVLVTLFAAAPNPVTMPILARETLSEPDMLRSALDRLDDAGALKTERVVSGEVGLQLTSAGSRLAVLLIYRVLTAAF